VGRGGVWGRSGRWGGEACQVTRRGTCNATRRGTCKATQVTRRGTCNATRRGTRKATRLVAGEEGLEDGLAVEPHGYDQRLEALDRRHLLRRDLRGIKRLHRQHSRSTGWCLQLRRPRCSSAHTRPFSLVLSTHATLTHNTSAAESPPSLTGAAPSTGTQANGSKRLLDGAGGRPGSCPAAAPAAGPRKPCAARAASTPRGPPCEGRGVSD